MLVCQVWEKNFAVEALAELSLKQAPLPVAASLPLVATLAHLMPLIAPASLRPPLSQEGGGVQPSSV